MVNWVIRPGRELGSLIDLGKVVEFENYTVNSWVEVVEGRS